MDLTDLALSDKERKESNGPCAVTDSKDSKGPKYSYGTRIHLGPSELKKLGWKVGDFEVGQDLRVEANVKVVELSQNASENGSSARVELQITSLGLDEDDAGPVGAVSRGVKEANS